jgi:hypothetical protein
MPVVDEPPTVTIGTVADADWPVAKLQNAGVLSTLVPPPPEGVIDNVAAPVAEAASVAPMVQVTSVLAEPANPKEPRVNVGLGFVLALVPAWVFTQEKVKGTVFNSALLNAVLSPFATARVKLPVGAAMEFHFVAGGVYAAIAAATKASVAKSVEVSPVVCVVAVVPFGSVGVPDRLAAVPEVLAALFGMSPETSAPHTGAVAALAAPVDIRNSRVVVAFPARRVAAPDTPPYITSPRVVIGLVM